MGFIKKKGHCRRPRTHAICGCRTPSSDKESVSVCLCESKRKNQSTSSCQNLFGALISACVCVFILRYLQVGERGQIFESSIWDHSNIITMERPAEKREKWSLPRESKTHKSKSNSKHTHIHTHTYQWGTHNRRRDLRPSKAFIGIHLSLL